jgi:hypothetical protein
MFAPDRIAIWCARPAGIDGPARVINAGSPEALVAAIAEQDGRDG